MKQWECTVCGYIHLGEEPPEICPVCGADRTKFILLDQESPTHMQETDSEHKDATISAGNKNWRCSVCGYVQNAAHPPEVCPVCGAEKTKFMVLEDNGEATQNAAGEMRRQNSKPAKENVRQPLFNVTNLARALKPESPFSKLLTRFHGHPISVHIPNGVLPLAVFFTLIAVLFDSTPFAIAAKYNLIFVCFFMPVVIFTGLVDWSNRYKARITKVFKIKMICAAIVLGVSFILALWWIIQPEIYLKNSGLSILFVFLHVIDFGAAAMAGWYGGKLVFPKK